MDWQERLITLYEPTCKQYREHLWVYCQRFSRYADLRFSDEEALCIYLWGVMDKRQELKAIYDYTQRHLREWFPRRLPRAAELYARLGYRQIAKIPHYVGSFTKHIMVKPIAGGHHT